MALPPRDPALLAECRALQHAVTAHATLAALERSPAWPALSARLHALLDAVRVFAPAAPPGPPRAAGELRVVQWNAEHGNQYARLERALREHPELAGADLVTLDEVDLGCARSGNRDVAFALADALGLHAVWAPLFLETTVGRDDDPRMAAGRDNEEGLFGIAVLARWPLARARVVALPGPRERTFEHERMAGGHAALAVDVLRPGAPFVAVAAHLTVHFTRAVRAAQMRAVLDALAGETRPVVLAGDFNSHTFERDRADTALRGAATLALTPASRLRARLRRPDRGPAREVLFDALRAAGFAWEPWSDAEPTLRLRPERLHELRGLPSPLRGAARALVAALAERAALRLDWICARGVAGGEGRTVTGLDGPDGASDHAPIVARLHDA